MRIPSGIILSLMKVAALMQLPIQKLAENFDIELDTLINSEYISLNQFESLIEDLIELSPKKDFHIHFARHFTFSHIEGLEALIISNSKGSDAIKEVFTYKSLFMPLFDVKVNLSTSGDTISYMSNDAQPISDKYYYAEMVFTLILEFGHRLLNIEHMVERLAFRHSKTSYHDNMERLFKCKISYDADIDCVWTKKGVLQTRFTSTQQTLHDSALEILSKQLQEEQAKNSITQQVSDLLFINLSNPDINISTIAEKLNISARSLQRLLQNENTNFNTLKQSIKLSNAKKRLLKTNQPLSRISESLGFTEVTSFSRFFKTHIGSSPSSFRKSKINQ